MPRLLALATAVAVVLGGGALVSSSVQTRAAWTDRVAASAAVSAGEWTVPVTNGCVAVYTASQQPVPGASCRISGSSVNQWTNGVDVVRDYYVSLSSSVSGAGIQLLVTIDLSTVTGGGAWTWGTSTTVTSGSHTVTSTCAELPVLRATMPSNYGYSQTLYQRVVEKSTMPMATGKTCR